MFILLPFSDVDVTTTMYSKFYQRPSLKDNVKSLTPSSPEKSEIVSKVNLVTDALLQQMESVNELE